LSVSVAADSNGSSMPIKERVFDRHPELVEGSV
jgi:hypothetical protein